MTDIKRFMDKILEMTNAIDRGVADPLQFSLIESYQELRTIDTDLEVSIELDEYLNNILGAKVNRVQEIARVIGTPELYVSRLETLRAKQIAAMASYHQPFVLRRLDYQQLALALNRLLSLVDAHQCRDISEEAPDIIDIPDDFVFDSEDAITPNELDEFLKAIPEGVSVPIRNLMQSSDIDDFLRRFLMIIMLVADGHLGYDPENRTVMRIGVTTRQ